MLIEEIKFLLLRDNFRGVWQYLEDTYLPRLVSFASAIDGFLQAYSINKTQDLRHYVWVLGSLLHACDVILRRHPSRRR